MRVWVAGCATGEEAYSLAILLHEQLEAIKRPIEVKIFATDAHKSSLDIAGAGIYDGYKLTEVSAARLRRYFVKKHDGFHVSHELRNMIVFAPHDVIKDAPFTKLNLISCRNLLIYLQPQAQKKVLSLFHFALKGDGILFLGSSESPGELAEEFDTVNEQCKIYRKRRDIRLPAMDMEFTPAPAQTAMQNAVAVRLGTASNANKTLLLETYDQLLDRFMPSSLLINENRELLDSFGGAERFLRIKSRRPSTNVLELLNVDLKATVAGGLRRAEKDRKAVHYSGVRLQSEGNGQEEYRLFIEPLYNPRYHTAHFLITLQPLREVKPILADNRPDDTTITIDQRLLENPKSGNYGTFQINDLACASGYFPTASKLYAAESQAAVQTVFAELQETGAVHDAELKLIRQDGSTLDVSLNVSALLDENGRIVRSRSMWRDITARKQAEEELREAVRQRKQFLAMLSHELRNPLNALQNATVLLNMEGVDTNTAAMARHLVERQTAHMIRLLDDLLDVSRITQNKLELRREQTDLTRIIEYAVDTVRGLFEQREKLFQRWE